MDVRKHCKPSTAGNKQRAGSDTYEPPGLRISGAVTLAVEEANSGKLCCGHRYRGLGPGSKTGENI